MNQKVVQFEMAAGMQMTKPLVATGENFPDALCGGALAGKWNVPLVMVNSANSAGVSELVNEKAAIRHGYFLGGNNAINNSICEAIAAKTDMTFDPNA